MIPNLPDSETDASALLDVLKQLLRDRRIGYQAIAGAMEVSLPTVKRMLNRPNLPVDRFFAICQIAQLDPAEVFAQAARNRPKHTIFSEEQDELFHEQPAFMSYFMRLMAGQTADQIAESEGLTEVSTNRYLSGLARVELIEREVGNRVRVLVESPIGFGPDSKVLRASHAEFLQHTVGQVVSPDPPPGVFAILKPLRLKEKLYREMLKELAELVDRYAFHSEHPGNREVPDRQNWNLTIASGPGMELREAPIINL